MRHGKKPTRAQRKLMEKWRLNPADWLVVTNTPEAMTIVHRHFDGKTKKIPKWRGVDD